MCVCAHIPRYVCEGKSCMRKGMDLKKIKKKTPALERKERNMLRRGTENVCCCLKDPYKPTKGAFWKDVYFDMFISQGNSKDERVEQDLMFPRFWANDKFLNFRIDELQHHAWLYPLNSNKNPNS